jgi:two-component system, LuxR family, sensor kinase FixL
MQREQAHATVDNSAANEMAAILAAAVDGIVLIDRDSVILEFNPAAERMFGYSRAEVVGQPVSMLMPEPYRSGHPDYVGRYLATHEPRVIGIGREVKAQRRDGSTFPVWLSVSEADTPRGVRFVGIVRDLSEQRAAQREQAALEARLEHVARFSLMGEMAAGIAHEINQPLSAIATYAQAGRRLLSGDDWSRQEIEDLCVRITEQGQRAGQVIANLRSFIRKQELQTELVDVNDVIEDVMSLIQADAKSAGLPVRVEFDVNMPHIMANAVQLQQVVLNLTRNAVDAMRTHRDREKGIVIKTQSAPGEVKILVIDHGPGVAKGLGSTIFNPFVTTKRDGLGVGLAISRTIVEAHSGRLGCRPNRGGGAVFEVSIPTTTGE